MISCGPKQRMRKSHPRRNTHTHQSSFLNLLICRPTNSTLFTLSIFHLDKFAYVFWHLFWRMLALSCGVFFSLFFFSFFHPGPSPLPKHQTPKPKKNFNIPPQPHTPPPESAPRIAYRRARRPSTRGRAAWRPSDRGGRRAGGRGGSCWMR